MNFLFFATSNFKPETGGVAEFGHQFAEALSLQGHGVIVIASRLSPSEKEINSSYTIVRTTKKDLVREVEKTLAFRRIDGIFILIITSSWRIAYMFGKKHHIPVMLYIHGIEITKKNNNYPIYRLKQCIKSVMIKKTDILFCNSAYTLNQALKPGVRTDRVFVLHPGILPHVDTAISVKDPAPDKTVFFTMGRLVRRKGVDYAIMALAHLVKDYPNILYVIGGAGSEYYEESLKSLVKELCLENHVIFLGAIDNTTKELWYQRHDVFIMASRQLPDGDIEGFGIVFLEAALYGKPVIAGRSGGIPDAVEDGKSGLLVDPYSITAIAEGMKYFLENPLKKKEMGDYGRNRVKNDFNWLRQADNFVRIVQDFKRSIF